MARHDARPLPPPSGRGPRAVAVATCGAFPADNVTLGADGTTLYGLTQAGGANDPQGTSYYGTGFSFPVP